MITSLLLSAQMRNFLDQALVPNGTEKTETKIAIEETTAANETEMEEVAETEVEVGIEMIGTVVVAMGTASTVLAEAAATVAEAIVQMGSFTFLLDYAMSVCYLFLILYFLQRFHSLFE